MAAQVIASVAPTQASPGDVVTITGTGFSTVAGATTVKFGDTPAKDIKVVSATSITATVPSVPAGPVPVVVTAGGAPSPAYTFPVFTSIPITVSQTVIKPDKNGKLQSPVNLTITEQNCDENSGIDLTQAGGAPFAIFIEGPAGLSQKSNPPNKCNFTSTITVDPTTQAGTYGVVLQNKDGKYLGRAPAAITVMDASAGPIPPGLAPTVDVMWEVMSQKNCSDAFGARVAQADYCIDLKIGNDSGYALQIAGIGFASKLDNNPQSWPVIIANNSYASTRAVLLTSMFTERRNVAYNILAATGVLMAGFTPYFGTGHHPNGTINNARLNWTTAASIVSGPVLAAFNIISPNPVITQLNNLDDQSFRDNKVIANNSHMQTVVFVEKKALTYQLDDLASRYPNLFKGDTTAMGASNAKDGTNYKHLNETVDNSRNEYRIKRGSFSPLLVKLALGSVVIVGDQIQYLNRIQIQSSASSSPAATPLSASPASLSFASQGLLTASSEQTLTLTNNGTSQLTSLSPTITGENKDDFTLSSNTCSTTLAASATCKLGVTFKPTAKKTADRTATLNVGFSPGSTPLAIALTGTASIPGDKVAISPAIPDPLKAAPGATAKVTITLGNVNDTSLTFSAAPALTPAPIPPAVSPFVISANTCRPTNAPSTLPSESTCSIEVTYTAPAAAAPAQFPTATLTVSYQLNGGTVTKPPINLTSAAP